MITGLDHIAIAVPDFDKAITRFLEDFELTFEGTEDVAAAKTRTAFFPVPATSIELLNPLNGEGPIEKYLEKRGGGLHHLCFRTNDIHADVERLKAKGYVFLSEEPGPGAHDSLTIFIHPKSSDGILIELAQPASDHA